MHARALSWRAGFDRPDAERKSEFLFRRVDGAARSAGRNHEKTPIDHILCGFQRFCHGAGLVWLEDHAARRAHFDRLLCTVETCTEEIVTDDDRIESFACHLEAFKVFFIQCVFHKRDRICLRQILQFLNQEVPVDIVAAPEIHAALFIVIFAACAVKRIDNLVRITKICHDLRENLHDLFGIVRERRPAAVIADHRAAAVHFLQHLT